MSALARNPLLDPAYPRCFCCAYPLDERGSCQRCDTPAPAHSLSTFEREWAAPLIAEAARRAERAA